MLLVLRMHTCMHVLLLSCAERSCYELYTVYVSFSQSQCQCTLQCAASTSLPQRVLLSYTVLTSVLQLLLQLSARLLQAVLLQRCCHTLVAVCKQLLQMHCCDAGSTALQRAAALICTLLHVHSLTTCETCTHTTCVCVPVAVCTHAHHTLALSIHTSAYIKEHTLS
jgi:hypothetical protein